MLDKYLPLGSVVLLKNGSKKIMITGYFSVDSDKSDVIYDYNGCFYPEGLLKSDQVCLFQHSQIDSILFQGFCDEEGTHFGKWLEEFSSHFASSSKDVEILDEE